MCMERGAVDKLHVYIIIWAQPHALWAWGKTEYKINNSTKNYLKDYGVTYNSISDPMCNKNIFTF